MKIVLRPWMSVFAVNLRDFKARNTSQRGIPNSVIGNQKKSIAAKVDFFVKGSNPDAVENPAGSVEYRVAADQSACSGFDRQPVSPDVLLPDADIAAVSAAVEAVVRQFINDPSDDDLESGPVSFMQLNRLHISLPYNEPRSQFVLGSYGSYTDASFTNQMVDAGMEILFATDEFIMAQHGVSDPADIARIRTAFGIASLTDFFTGEGIVEVVTQTVSRLFSEFKLKCDQWSSTNVETLMDNFGGALATIAGGGESAGN